MSHLIDVRTLDAEACYHLLWSLIVPRPIGWISSISPSGIANLAPFSCFNIVSNNPPILMVSPSLRKNGDEKDTLRNIRQTKNFVHNVVTRDLAEKMNITSEEFSYGVSEFEKAGLTIEASSFISSPRVAEALVNIECELHEIYSFGNQADQGQLIFGRILAVHINDKSLLDERGRIRPEKLQVISRLGGPYYLDFGPVFKMKRP